MTQEQKLVKHLMSLKPINPVRAESERMKRLWKVAEIHRRNIYDVEAIENWLIISEMEKIAKDNRETDWECFGL